MIRILLRVVGPEHAGALRRAVALVFVTAVLEGLSYALLVPLLDALLDGRTQEAWTWTGVFGVAFIGYAALRYASDLVQMRVGTSMLHGMYTRFADRLARLPIGWYEHDRVGEVSSLASRGLISAMGIVAHLLSPSIAAVATPVAILTVLTSVDWRLGLVAAVAVPVLILVQRGTERAATVADDEQEHAQREATSRVVEYVQAQQVLRVAGRSGEGFTHLEDALRNVRRASRRTVRAVLPASVGLAFTGQAVFVAILMAGAHYALSGQLTPAVFLAALLLMARGIDPILALPELAGRLRHARGELERLDAVLRTPSLPEPSEPRRPERTDLSADEVTVVRDGRTVLDRLSLTVPMGSRMALVGSSGAGKSTLLQLLARFHDPDAGAIRLGGVDLRDMAVDDLTSRIAFVFQDVYLFDGTIEDNIRFARPDAGDTAFRAAATAAQLDEVIARLPEGWATRVGEGGTRLSGGERQRVSIARALIKDAPIVLLDEITASLDPENEAALMAAIEELTAGRTTVLVAHRMTTIRTVDRIAFVQHGRVVEEGTHDDLVHRDGPYARFWKLSSAGSVHAPPT